MPPILLILMVIGGLLYSVGAFVYKFQRPNPFPKIFGFHEIFHVFILLGWLAHYLQIYFSL